MQSSELLFQQLAADHAYLEPENADPPVGYSAATGPQSVRIHEVAGRRQEALGVCHSIEVWAFEAGWRAQDLVVGSERRRQTKCRQQVAVVVELVRDDPAELGRRLVGEGLAPLGLAVFEARLAGGVADFAVVGAEARAAKGIAAV